MVLPNFVRQALAGTPITVYGNGQQSRCFGYVEDVVEAMIRLMGCEHAVGQVVNIGNTEEITIADLAEASEGACQQRFSDSIPLLRRGLRARL